jgi:hypothetical protein
LVAVEIPSIAWQAMQGPLAKSSAPRATLPPGHGF